MSIYIKKIIIIAIISEKLDKDNCNYKLKSHLLLEISFLRPVNSKEQCVHYLSQKLCFVNCYGHKFFILELT